MARRIRVAHVATIDLTVRALLLPQLRALMSSGFDVTAISAPGRWVPEIEREGVRHIAWHHATRAWDLLEDGRAFAELIGILRRERFDVVHTHNAKPGVMGRVGARVARARCVVNTVHGFDARPDDRVLRRLAFMGFEWGAARFSDLELYQGEADLVRARRLRMLRPGQGVFIGNGTDLTRFDPAAVDRSRVAAIREELGAAPADVVVGTIGRLVGEKGYRELIPAARAVRSRFAHARFVAIGDRDAAKDDALSEAEIEDAADTVTFLGWRDDVVDVLASMDVFVLPSWREGVPRSAIEAAAMALPSVLSDIPGCRQVARDGVEALFVTPRDPKALTGAIEALVADPGRRSSMGTAARARALDRFDERRIVATIAERYERLLGDGRQERAR
jgi:glycosyltransferase involved in cell wall biosynthesis